VKNLSSRSRLRAVPSRLTWFKRGSFRNSRTASVNAPLRTQRCLRCAESECPRAFAPDTWARDELESLRRGPPYPRWRRLPGSGLSEPKICVPAHVGQSLSAAQAPDIPDPPGPAPATIALRRARSSGSRPHRNAGVNHRSHGRPRLPCRHAFLAATSVRCSLGPRIPASRSALASVGEHLTTDPMRGVPGRATAP
jgi:hypothetical protein